MSESTDEPTQGQSDEAEAAKKAEEKHESAQETMKKLEEADELPSNLEEWPDDEAKYVTFGGPEGEHSYAEGVEAKLGPSDLERHADGSVSIEGEKVDNPDEHKADPVPGGPTDPDARELPGERRKREKMQEMYGEDGQTDAVKKAKGEEGDDENDEGEEKADEAKS